MTGIDVSNLMSRPLKKNNNQPIKLLVYEKLDKKGNILNYCPSPHELKESPTLKRVQVLNENWKMKKIDFLFGVSFYNSVGYEERKQKRIEDIKRKKEFRKIRKNKKLNLQKDIKNKLKVLKADLNKIKKSKRMILVNLNRIEKLRNENKKFFGKRLSQKNIERKIEITQKKIKQKINEMNKTKRSKKTNKIETQPKQENVNK